VLAASCRRRFLNTPFFPKGTHSHAPHATVTNLIRHATTLVTGWRTRPVPREAWHEADDILMTAALLDEQRVMPVWEWLTAEYEEWVGEGEGEVRIGERVQLKN
jgi:hypothetical protein